MAGDRTGRRPFSVAILGLPRSTALCDAGAVIISTRIASIALGFGLLIQGTGWAQVFDEDYTHWPEDLRINGKLVAGSELSAETIEAFLPNAAAEKRIALFHRKNSKAVGTIIHSNRLIATAGINETLSLRLNELADTCDVLLLLGLRDGDLTAAMAAPLHAILERGGTIVCEGSPAAIAMTGAMTGAFAKGGTGLNLFPDCVLASHFDSSSAEAKGRMLSILAQHPRSVGIGITAGSGMILSGRKLRITGEGSATMMLMANERQPLRVESITAPNPQRQAAPEEFLADLTEWRRDAIDRTLPAFPPTTPRVPKVDHGTLVIVGGGGVPRGLMDEFIDLAGGKDKARLVYIPCEERDIIKGMPSLVKTWERAGVARATFLHTKDRSKSNTDEAFLAPLKDATGIWFGGGRQWNFADSYYGTKAHQLMKEVLHRGGVIGGSSAGASIQARYLARATPIGNFRIMAPGYERGGLGFISGVAIDQHFSQRGRQKDMTQLMARHPQLLGIGIDETTALIVTGSTGRVVGAGRVYFYDRNLPVYPDAPDYMALEAGKAYNLATRSVVAAP
ncbi:MAG: cyanophycinase [Verrucomicrobiales bacterium]